MVKHIGILLSLAAIVGCAQGHTTEHFPAPLDPSLSAEVFVLRGGGLYLAAIGHKVILDGWQIARLGPGEYVRFQVTPGRHSVGITESTVSLEFVAGETYYFQLSPSGFLSDNSEIERITIEKGAELVAGLEDVSKKKGGTSISPLSCSLTCSPKAASS